MVNILVTGGLGYIGSHTCAKLIEEGHNIFILDSLVNSSLSVLENLEIIKNGCKDTRTRILRFFKGDIRNKEIIENIFLYSKNFGYQIDIVFHFAGLKSVRESNLHPDKYWDVNVEGTKVLITVMEANNCKNIIFSSSATVYGNKGIDIIKETYEINPNSIYGHTKAKVEEIFLEKYQNTREWKVINLRYFNPIGAHKSCLLGEYTNRNSVNLFPILCKVANKEIAYLEIFGNDWETKDGTCIRDFIHVIDIAEGHISALKYMLRNKCHFLSINLGTGKGTTILELIKTFQITTSHQINYIFSDRKDGDVASYVASKEKAEILLNWKPKLNLNEMCVDGWHWYLRNNIS